MLTKDQIEKISNAQEVEIYYKSPYKKEWAIVRYYCRKGEPMKVVSYTVRGERLFEGKPIMCFEYLASTNFVVVDHGFETEEAAIAKMKELKKGVN